MADTRPETDRPPTLLELGGIVYVPPALGDVTLLLVDFQNEYLAGPLALPGVWDAVDRANILLNRVRGAGGSVVHVAHAGLPESLFDRLAYRGAFITAVTPLPSEPVVEKRLANAFAGTDLETHIPKERPLIVAGFMTHNCVASTVRAAFDKGFRTIVAHDACAARALPDPTGGSIPADQVHRVELAAIADRHAWVRSVSELTSS